MLKTRPTVILILSVIMISILFTSACTNNTSSHDGNITLEFLNVSYDPTRELYDEFNTAFAHYWEKTHHQKMIIHQSHGGSGKQARSVIDGLEADVVTLALSGDIDKIQDAGLISKGWQSEFQENSSPYTSTIVFLVRKGNPKAIKDWDDLVKPDIEVITPNPKTSGGARWNFLAAWSYALNLHNQDESKAFAFVEQLYKNVKVLDTGARDSTTTFVERGIGDVFITWENEAHLSLREVNDQFEMIIPSRSILAEPSIAVVDQVVDKQGTREVAEAYLAYLYTEEGQTIAAKNFYRPRLESVAKQFADQFPAIELTTIEDFGGWSEVQPKFFDDKAIFDQIYVPSK